MAIAEGLKELDLPTRAPYRLKLDAFWHFNDAVGIWVSGETPQENELDPNAQLEKRSLKAESSVFRDRTTAQRHLAVTLQKHSDDRVAPETDIRLDRQETSI